MASVFNRLTGSASTLSSLGGSGEWYVSGASYTNLLNSDIRVASEFKQVELTPTASACYIQIDSVSMDASDYQYAAQMTFGVNMPAGGEINVKIFDDGSQIESFGLTNFTIPPTTSSLYSSSLQNPAWRVYRTNEMYVPSYNGAHPVVSIEIEFIPDNQSDKIYFTSPILCSSTDAARFGEALLQMVRHIPVEYLDTGDIQQNPDYALQRFVDVAFEGLDRALKQSFSFQHYDISEGYDENDNRTKSYLVNPDVADTDELKWLAQFTGTEPISKLESSVDPSDPFILGETEGDGFSTLNGGDALRFTTSALLEPPQNTAELQKEFLQWQAANGYYGINAGSITAVEEAVKRLMIGEQQVSITIQHNGPFTVLIETPWEQTYGASEEKIGESLSVVEEAISYAKPIGVKVTHVLT
jgi:hypothetical protein